MIDWQKRGKVVLLPTLAHTSWVGCSCLHALLPGRTLGLQSQLLLTAVVPEEEFAGESVHG